MKKDPVNKNSRVTFLIIQFAIVFYAIFELRIFHIRDTGQFYTFFTIVIGVGICMLLVAVIHGLRRFLNESFFIPMILYLVYLLTAIKIDHFYYFTTVLFITCLAALYLNPKTMLAYLVITNIISLVLIYGGIPIRYELRGISEPDVMSQWFILLFCSVVIYIVMSYASGKNKLANKAKDSFISVLESSSNYIILLDSQNRVTYISRTLLNLLNFSKPCMAVGRPAMDLFNDMRLKDMLYDVLSTEGSFQVTREIVWKGKPYYLEVAVYELSKRVTGRLISIVDITPIVKAKQKAEAASESKSAFLAAMSHEIRTPLNAIIGLSEIELQKKQSHETHVNLEKIHISGSSLLSIINDILDISKIEAGNFSLVPADYDMPKLINDTVHLNTVRIGLKDIVFKLEIDETIPVKLYGDEIRITQILNNLLSNAIKYTKKGSVTLKVGWRPSEENALIIFTVQDTGQGIREKDKKELFKNYTQLDMKANRNIEGTGLGLSITKNLVELMNGEISVESEYGKGSTFEVKIPQLILDKSPIGEITAKNLMHFRLTEARYSQNLNFVRASMPYGKILVVDDVQTNLDVVRGLLKPYDLTVDYAASGQEAIEKIRNGSRDDSQDSGYVQYDLVLMDHMMPVMDGLETVKIIRSEIDSDYARNVPIIALTANVMAGSEEMFISNGFNGYISKPIDVIQLNAVLETWIKKKQNKETLLQAEKKEIAMTDKHPQNDSNVLDGFFVDGIDLLKGREKYNDEATYLSVLRSYCKHTEPILKKLRSISRLEQDSNEPRISLEDYVILIHGLKGSSYGIFANSIGKEAGILEDASRAGNIEQVQKGNIPFVNKVELLLSDLNRLLEKTAVNKGQKQKTAEPSKELLKKLLDAVTRYKTTTMEEALEELESFEYETGSELVVWLREQIDNLEYDLIKEKLEKLV